MFMLNGSGDLGLAITTPFNGSFLMNPALFQAILPDFEIMAALSLGSGTEVTSVFKEVVDGIGIPMAGLYHGFRQPTHVSAAVVMQRFAKKTILANCLLDREAYSHRGRDNHLSRGEYPCPGNDIGSSAGLSAFREAGRAGHIIRKLMSN